MTGTAPPTDAQNRSTAATVSRAKAIPLIMLMTRASRSRRTLRIISKAAAILASLKSCFRSIIPAMRTMLES